ncbi:MAG: hypothetical protein HY619_00660 [Thaumarchaeota archaeon]|nr:hypothetical protein [Nitrososphaerota archaeon]
MNGLPPGETRKKVEGMLDTLKDRVDAGDYIPRRLWPRDPAYQDIRNLFRYEIDRVMRACYTIKREGDKFTVRVIEIFPNHKSYERRFHY